MCLSIITLVWTKQVGGKQIRVDERWQRSITKAEIKISMSFKFNITARIVANRGEKRIVEDEGIIYRTTTF